MLDGEWTLTVLDENGDQMEEGGPNGNILCAIPGRSFQVKVKYSGPRTKCCVLYLDGKQTSTGYFLSTGQNCTFEGWLTYTKEQKIVSKFLFAKPPILGGGGRKELEGAIGSIELKVYTSVPTNGGILRGSFNAAAANQVTEKQAVKDGRGVTVGQGAEVSRTRQVVYQGQTYATGSLLKVVRLIYRDPYYFDRLNGTNFARLMMPDPGADDDNGADVDDNDTKAEPNVDPGSEQQPLKKQRTDTAGFEENELIDLTTN